MVGWKHNHYLFVTMSAFLGLERRIMALTVNNIKRNQSNTIPKTRVTGRPFQIRHQSLWSLSASSTNNKNENSDNQEFEPTWSYVPYDASKAKYNKPRNTSQPRRSFSTWKVPKTVRIPEDQLDIQFVRSSGSGGQNVNKLSTKVELRFLVREADWLPKEVRDRLSTQQANRINKDGYLSLTCQENRTQGQNRKAALDKLKVMCLEAWPRPKIRKQRRGISKAEKERRKDFKRKRSETKKNRKGVDW